MPTLQARVTLEPDFLETLTYATADSGKHPDDWLHSKLLDMVKSTSGGYRRWKLGKPIEGQRPKAGSRTEVESFIVEAKDIPVGGYLAPDQLPEEKEGSLTLQWDFLNERFAFSYALSRVIESRVGAPRRQFNATTFQEALDERVREIIMDGAAAEDDRQIKESQDALSDSSKRKKKDAKP